MGLNARGRAPKSGGFPAWLVFLVAIALVFGAFYLFRGVQTFFRTGGLGVQEATERAEVVSSVTAERQVRFATTGFTPQATFTPIPECQDFRVIVPNAVVRDAPSFNGATVTGYSQNAIVCVLGVEAVEWYLIDTNPETRRIEPAYMNAVVIEAVNPTLTPSITATPLPTVTSAPVTPSAIPPSITPFGVDSRPTLPPLNNDSLQPPSPQSTERASISATNTDAFTPTPFSSTTATRLPAIRAVRTPTLSPENSGAPAP